jgi:hypothetical protein
MREKREMATTTHRRGHLYAKSYITFCEKSSSKCETMLIRMTSDLKAFGTFRRLPAAKGIAFSA